MMNKRPLFLLVLLMASPVSANEKRVGVLTVVDRDHEFSSQQCLEGAGPLVEKSSRFFSKSRRALFGPGAEASWYCYTPKLSWDPRYETAEQIVALAKKKQEDPTPLMTEASGVGKILCYGSSSFENGQLVAGVNIHHDRPEVGRMSGVKDYGDLGYLKGELGEEKFSKQIDDFLNRCARQHFEAVQKNEEGRVERRLLIDTKG